MPNVWRLIAHHEKAADVVDHIRRIGQIYIGWGKLETYVRTSTIPPERLRRPSGTITRR